jgi:hypothetical protein
MIVVKEKLGSQENLATACFFTFFTPFSSYLHAIEVLTKVHEHTHPVSLFICLVKSVTGCVEDEFGLNALMSGQHVLVPNRARTRYSNTQCQKHLPPCFETFYFYYYKEDNIWVSTVIFSQKL